MPKRKRVRILEERHNRLTATRSEPPSKAIQELTALLEECNWKLTELPHGDPERERYASLKRTVFEELRARANR